MSARKPSNLAWLVQVIDEYDQKKIVAEIVVVQPDGELHSPGSYRFDEGHEFRDLRVTGYLGWGAYLTGSDDPTRQGEVWGLSHEFEPHTVKDTEDAQRMVKIFQRIDRANKKAVTEFGYVAEGDYFTYLTRIAAALGVRRYFVRNHRERLDSTGERYWSVTGVDLQTWLRSTSEYAQNKPGMLVTR